MGGDVSARFDPIPATAHVVYAVVLFPIYLTIPSNTILADHVISPEGDRLSKRRYLVAGFLLTGLVC